MSGSFLFEGVVRLLLTGVSVLIVAKLLPGISVSGYGASVAFAFVLALFNVVAWRLLALFTIPFSVFTLGIGYFIVNTLVFLVAGHVVDGVRISGFFAAAVGAAGVGILNSAMHLLFGRYAP